MLTSLTKLKEEPSYNPRSGDTASVHGGGVDEALGVFMRIYCFGCTDTLLS